MTPRELVHLLGVYRAGYARLWETDTETHVVDAPICVLPAHVVHRLRARSRRRRRGGTTPQLCGRTAIAEEIDSMIVWLVISFAAGALVGTAIHLGTRERCEFLSDPRSTGLPSSYRCCLEHDHRGPHRLIYSVPCQVLRSERWVENK